MLKHLLFRFSNCQCVKDPVLLLPARELLNSGVSPDLVNEDGLTALHQVNEHRIALTLYDSGAWP